MASPAVNLILRSARDPLLFRYSAGNSIAGLGGTFSRTSTATYTDASGVIQTAASGVLRDAHYVGGVRTTLLEGSRTNLALWSSALENASWFKGPDASITANVAIAPDGTTTADRITFATDSANSEVYQAVTATSGQPYTISIDLKADTASSVALQIQSSTGALISTISASLTGAWQRFTVTGTATDSAVRLRLRCGSGQQTLSFFAANGQVELGAFSSSRIPTTSATVTRAADSLSFPFTAPPQEMSVYARFAEQGSSTPAYATSVPAPRILHIGAASTFPLLAIYGNDGSPAGAYSVNHTLSSGNNSITNQAAPVAFGSLTELVTTLSAAGRTQNSQSVAGAASTTGTEIQTGTVALGSAWSAQTLTINDRPDGARKGFNAFRDILIYKGTRDMSYFRSKTG